MSNNIIFMGALVLFLLVGIGLFFGGGSKSPKTSSKSNEEKTPDIDKLIKKCTNQKLKNGAKEELKKLKANEKV